MADSQAPNDSGRVTALATDSSTPPYDRHGLSVATSTLHPQPFRMLSPLHRRILAVLAPLAVVAVVWAYEFDQRNQEVQRLVNEITNAGGYVMLETPLWRKYLARWRGHLFYRWTWVCIHGTAIDDEWLRERDYLTAFNIDFLAIGDCSVTVEGVAGLIERHSIEDIIVPNFHDCDAIAASLGAEKSLCGVSFSDTDLSDAGFRQLPLEQLTVISVEGTRVTPRGLLELKRCRRLSRVSLDGRQFDDAVAELLGEQRQIDHLCLFGEVVSDDHLAQIEEMNVRRVELTGTCVTQEGIAALRIALPKCQIRIYDASGAPSSPD